MDVPGLIVRGHGLAESAIRGGELAILGFRQGQVEAVVEALPRFQREFDGSVGHGLDWEQPHRRMEEVFQGGDPVLNFANGE